MIKLLIFLEQDNCHNANEKIIAFYFSYRFLLIIEIRKLNFIIISGWDWLLSNNVKTF